MTSTNARLDNISRRLGEALGLPVAITIRGAGAFTFSTETVAPELGDRVKAFVGNLATVTVEHDAECGSFAYIDVAA